MKYLLFLSVLFLASCKYEADPNLFYVNEDFTLKSKDNNVFLISRNNNPEEITALTEASYNNSGCSCHWGDVSASLNAKQVGANVHFDYIRKERFQIQSAELLNDKTNEERDDSLNVVILHQRLIEDSIKIELLHQRISELENQPKY